MTIEALLGANSVTCGLSPEHRKAIAAICSPRKLSKRESLFLEGQKGDKVYLLAEGSVQLSKSSEDGRQIVIRTVESGEMFAEVVLFESEQYPVSAAALSPCMVYGISKRHFHALLEERGFRSQFIASLLRKMRYLADRILLLTLEDVEERFFRFLESQYGQRKDYEIRISKKDLAAAIGTTPESLSRLIARLKKRKALSWKGRKLNMRSK
jgi:CRP/FNR family transcriptional regulator, dissimilatory nitrate respiration regulator